MTIYALPSNIHFRRIQGEGLGQSPVGRALSVRYAVGTFEATRGGATILQLPIRPCFEESLVYCKLSLDDAPANGGRGRTDVSMIGTGWFIEDGTTENIRNSNGGFATIQVDVNPLDGTPRYAAYSSGSSSSGMVALNGGWSAEIGVAQEVYGRSTSFIFGPAVPPIPQEFANAGHACPMLLVDNVLTAGDKFGAELDAIRAAGTGRLDLVGGVTDTVIAAARAYNTHGAFVDPSDIGVGPGLFDPAVTSGNYPLSLVTAHPTAFLRHSGHVMGIEYADESTFPNPTVGVAEPARTPAVIEQLHVIPVVRAPTYSVWKVVIEGNAQTMMFQHPVGSDYRRPKDIYQGVIVPLMGERRVPLYGFDIDTGAGTRLFYKTGETELLKYAQWFECKMLYDGSTTPILTIPPLGG